MDDEEVRSESADGSDREAGPSVPRESASVVPLSAEARGAALWGSGLSGAAALTYEVVWTRSLTVVFGSTVYAVSIMLATFMLGLSLGGFMGGRWADRSNDLMRLLGRIEAGIAGFGLLSLLLIQLLPIVYFGLSQALEPSFVVVFTVQLVLSAAALLGPTALMGATFPVVSKINTVAMDEVGVDVGKVYGVNTMGSVAGSLLAGFALIPLVGVRATTIAAALLNVVVALLMFRFAGQKPARSRTMVAGVLLLVGLFAGLLVPEPALTAGFYRLGYEPSLKDYLAAARRSRVLYDEESATGRVKVVEDADSRSLVHDGKVEGSNAPIDGATTYMLGLLPAFSAGRPNSALVIGLGTGYTAQSLLGTELNSVEVVEINAAVPPAARLFVGDTLEKDPRYALHIADARNYLALTDRKWDVITSEPSWPLSQGVSHLFTREFFELVRSRLEPEGTFAQWVPAYLLSRADFMMMYKTFHSVFPNTQVWAVDAPGFGSNDLIFIGVNGDREVDTELVHQAGESALEQVGLSGQSFHLFDAPKTLEQSLTDASVPLNTDDHPRLETRVVRNALESFRGNPDVPDDWP